MSLVIQVIRRTQGRISYCRTLLKCRGCRSMHACSIPTTLKKTVCAMLPVLFDTKSPPCRYARPSTHAHTHTLLNSRIKRAWKKVHHNVHKRYSDKTMLTIKTNLLKIGSNHAAAIMCQLSTTACLKFVVFWSHTDERYFRVYRALITCSVHQA